MSRKPQTIKLAALALVVAAEQGHAKTSAPKVAEQEATTTLQPNETLFEALKKAGRVSIGGDGPVYTICV